MKVMSPAKLKIAMNSRLITIPHGGGNNFVNYIDRYLTEKGCLVTRELIPDLDLILFINVGPSLSTMTFSPADTANYLRKYPQAAVLQRINTLDEPRGKNQGINDALLRANMFADYSVFVSDFCRQVLEAHGFDVGKPNCVVHTGSDESIFAASDMAEINQGKPLRVVTHHWSDNYLKGFDFYERLDLLLGQPLFADKLEFTLIGNKPLSSKFRNTRLLPPLGGAELAAELRKHHFYVTGARCEPAGNHYIEALSCGLPVLYYDSGSTPEYCAGYGGIGFNHLDFEEKLKLMVDNLSEQREKVLNYNYTARDMADKYWELITQLVEQSRQRAYGRPSTLSLLGYKLKGFWNKSLEKICYELDKLKIEDDR
jgi:glycosyltransferase involved in cell wall biosynthesis